MKKLSLQTFIAVVLLFLVACSTKTTDEPLNRPSAGEDYLKANQFHLDAKNDSALFYINLALEKADTSNYLEIIDIYILSSKITNNLSLYERAMKEALKALEISEHLHLIREKTKALLCIGNIHFKMYNDEMAKQYVLQAKAIAEENDFETEIMLASLLLGQLYMELYDGNNDYNEEAYKLFDQALKIAENQADTINAIRSLLHIGDCCTNSNRFVDPDKIVKEHQQTAKKHLDEAMNLAVLKKTTLHQNFVRISLIRWNMVEKNYREGLKYAFEILDSTEDTPENYSMLLQACDHVVYLYSYLGEGKLTWTYHNKFRAMMMKESDYKLHRTLQEMSVQYETAEKELKIERQQTELERQQTRMYQLTGGLVFSVLLLAMLAYVIVQRTRRNRILAEMNTVKDKFFSIISHDLKNPVITQHNALQLLAENIDKWDTNTLSDYSKQLLKSSDDQMNLLKNLLEWSLLQRGRKTCIPALFNLAVALQPDINVIKNMAERKNITFETHIPETTIITADENMITTVVRNLLANAVKFTASGGTVTLDIAGECRDGARPVSTEYTISITGIGIPPEHLRNLFRLDSAHSKQGTADEKGTGLGLIVCKEMLEKHGSALHVESAEGKGSKFWFTI